MLLVTDELFDPMLKTGLMLLVTDELFDPILKTGLMLLVPDELFVKIGLILPVPDNQLLFILKIGLAVVPKLFVPMVKFGWFLASKIDLGCVLV
jgi:hypothetical protein